jgi:chromosome segregation ATPase
MAAPAETLEECYELLEEMRRMYSTDEDAAAVKELRRKRKDIAQFCDQREAHMAEIIQSARAARACVLPRARACASGVALRVRAHAWRARVCARAAMANRVADAEARATPPEPAEQHAARLAAAEAEVRAAAGEHDRLTTESEALDAEARALAAQRAAVAAQRAEADAAAQARAAELQCAPRTATRIRARHTHACPFLFLKRALTPPSCTAAIGTTWRCTRC